MSSVRALTSFSGKSVKYASMSWQLKMEYLKATLLCFVPVTAWAVYQETELFKIRNDDSYLDEILKSSDPLNSESQSQGMSRSQFTQQYNDRLMANDSRVRKRLEDEAYNALK
ncbi:hypothetical protein ACHWQZ_G008814 [Mnemiopsis leidyi]